MSSRLTAQVRDIALVTTAVADGDLSHTVTVEVSGEMAQLKDTVDRMVDQLSSFASEVTRVAREVGTEGRLGGQADVPGVSGTWKDLTDSVNLMASNLTSQVRGISSVAQAVARGDLSQQITVTARGEVAELAETLNSMTDHAADVRGRGHPGGTRGGHRGHPRRPGRRAGRGGPVEGPHRVGELHGRQPDRAGARHRPGDHGGGPRRPEPEDHRGRQGRARPAQEHGQRRWSTSCPRSPTR